MFNIVHNLEVVEEDVFYAWKNKDMGELKGDELYGRGNAVMSVKGFFDWLNSDQDDSQNQT